MKVTERVYLVLTVIRLGKGQLFTVMKKLSMIPIGHVVQRFLNQSVL